MRTTAKSGGLTVRAIAGTYNILIGFDLDPAKRANCLGFSIQRKDPQKTCFLPNRITFASTPEGTKLDTENSPLQKFRWGDYTTAPGTKYSYTVTARYRDGAGTPVKLKDGDSVTVTVTTEDPKNQATPIFFNRGAAASQAYNDEFGPDDPDKLPEPQRTKALAWLSRGLEEAILDFLNQATDKSFALHAAVYEFQKENLLGGLKAALDRKVDVQVVYHYRHKSSPKDKPGQPPKDHTWLENEKAAEEAGLTAVSTKRTQDNAVIMHNKFVVLLKNGAPIAVWTGSTNWTEGGIYGQLNVGHAVYDANVAKMYEAYFQLLKQDLPDAAMRAKVEALSPVPAPTALPGPGVLPVLSPQNDRGMLLLYNAIAQRARCLLVSAPFQLADEIIATLNPVPPGTMHYLLLDKESALGEKNEIDVIEHNMETGVAFAATLDSNLTSFQDKLLAKNGESYHHQGVHIHSKIIVADPFSDDPILVTGSANFSTNSTMHNDSNSLVVRGDLGVTDIYATEFMRMFEHYHFRAAKKKAGDQATVITLSETDDWSQKYFVPGSNEASDRMLFAGTLPPSPPNPFVPFKAPAKTPSTKKAATKKATTKKATTKKAATKKATAKKATAKKATTKKATTKKTATKKAATKKSAATKKTAKKTTKKPAKKAAKKAATKKAAEKTAKKKPASKKK